MDPVQQLELILKARTPGDIFTDLTTEAAINKTYRKLARISHPDMFSDIREKNKANQAFVKLTELWHAARKPVTTSSTVIKTKRHEYTLNDVLQTTEVFTIYNATYDAGFKNAEVFVTNTPRDTDLAEAHITALRKVKTEVNEEYRPYFPKLIETLRYRQPDGSEHIVVTTEKLDGMYSFRDVLKKYPEGINAKDTAWMFRRVLIALGNMHEVGMVHGAPNLDSLWIHPELHGLILNNWEYSVPTNTPLKAIPQEFKADYPEKVFKKQPVDYRLDLMLAAKTMLRLTDNKTPKQIIAFFKGCAIASTPEAPYLLHEFNELIERLWGERTFHHFSMD